MRKFKKEDLFEMDFKVYLVFLFDEDELEKWEEIWNGDNDLFEDEDKKIEKYKVSKICLWLFLNFVRGIVNFILLIIICLKYI